MDTTEVVEPTEPPVRAWATPEVECYETRCEVTAYAGGDGGPWLNH